MKRSFFQAAVVSILLYGCTTWTLTKRLEKKLDGNYTRMLRAILNISWRQHPTRHQLYGHLPPITKTIQVRQTRHAGHCWRSRDELIRDVLLWTPTSGRAKAGRPARTYIQQLCEDTGCSPEGLPEAMNDREKWRERVRDICAWGTTWLWWWWHHSIFRILWLSVLVTSLKIAPWNYIERCLDFLVENDVISSFDKTWTLLSKQIIVEFFYSDFDREFRLKSCSNSLFSVLTSSSSLFIQILKHWINALFLGLFPLVKKLWIELRMAQESCILIWYSHNETENPQSLVV